MSDGYFTDQSMLRRVHRERAIALSGPRALLMQAAHPLAVTGLLAHSTAMDEPYDRLARTAETMSTIGFGTREEADRVTTHVREMHTRVRGRIKEPVGTYPAGTPYRADQPDLLLWVLFTLVDSGVVVYRKYVGAHVARRGGRLLGRLQGRRRAVRADAGATCPTRSTTCTNTAARCSRATCCWSPTGPGGGRARS